ncbi:MAG: hypothetical protein IJ464_01605 [Alistipes sp.]|nr:hypothetical protein [Alistipes sp.]
MTEKGVAFRMTEKGVAFRMNREGCDAQDDRERCRIYFESNFFGRFFVFRKKLSIFVVAKEQQQLKYYQNYG